MSRNIAGLSVQNLGPGQSQVGIRGISAGKIDRDLPGVKEQVGVYMDESVISLSLFTPDLDLYDLNRVEVLRGPQGTLFGSGSLGGTVRYISNQPDLSDGYGSVEGGFNMIDDGGDGGFVRSMINMPMGDRAALRVVGYYNEMPGFIDARGPGGTLDEDVNNGERTGGRLALRWELTDNITVTPRIIYQDVDINGYNRRGRLEHARQPVHDDRTGRHASASASSIASSTERFRRRIHAGRPHDGVRLRRGRADVSQFVHGPRHPRDARRDAADRQRDVLQPRR